MMTARGSALVVVLGSACAPELIESDLDASSSAAETVASTTDSFDASSVGHDDSTTLVSGSSSSSDDASSSDGSGSTSTGSSGASSSSDDTSGSSSSSEATGTSSTTESSTTGPGTTGPGTTGPGTTGPGTTGPGATEPGTSEPGTTGAVTDTDPGSTSDAGESSTGDTDGDATCEATLFRTHVGRAEIHHDGDRFITRDEADNLVLWDTVTLDVLLETHASWADLAGGTLVYLEDDTLHVIASDTGAPLGEIDAEYSNGVARDGSYLWTASNAALQVFELDGTLRWSVAGVFASPDVLALGDALHLFGTGLSTSDVFHYAADDGSASSHPFSGAFGDWFADVPRFWSRQGTAYRVYDTDGSQLVVELGHPFHGWGTRLLVDDGIIDVFDPDVVLADVSDARQAYGAAILSRGDDGAELIHLDDDPITVEPVAPICCVDEDEWSFAYADGAWAIAGDEGRVADDLARTVSASEVVAIAGSTAGRVALAMADDLVRIADVADDCAWNEQANFPRVGRSMRMSGDGALLLSTERWQPMMGLTRDGTRFYALPDGALLGESSLNVSGESLDAHDVSDDGTLWSRRAWYLGSGSTTVGGAPLGAELFSGYSNVVPRIAPDGQHVAISDGEESPFQSWADSVTYIYEPDDFAGVVDGVAHGFVDDGHVLVGRYSDCGPVCLSFLGADIIDMTATVVVATGLPDLREIARIDDGAAAAIEYPSHTPVIYDLFAGTLLWEGPPGAEVAVAGADHVLISTGARVDLVRWR
jgi:hypothetical protein